MIRWMIKEENGVAAVPGSADGDDDHDYDHNHEEDNEWVDKFNTSCDGHDIEYDYLHGDVGAALDNDCDRWWCCLYLSVVNNEYSGDSL